MKVTDLQSFVASATEKHKTRYDYSKTVYVRSHSKVVITCPYHGDFRQEPHSHLRGDGCPDCSRTGFSPARSGYVYFMTSECFTMIKIGITHDPKTRTNAVRNVTPFGTSNLSCFFHESGEVILHLDNVLKSELPSANLQGFNGCTEWFILKPGSYKRLKSICASLGLREYTRFKDMPRYTKI
ncbi:hypothetical protein NVP1271B_82 [Vibrio phage 1.271.B._10N.286.54.B4]|nr:hypothetical protein NVP1027O_82 [Vibrio phage 1.027.O._10N.286.54.B8]AUR94462.1 hypothetical protein NVP1194O_82 [Vibrio phage 1.194.O._10N.286.54.B1]AUR94550.1 hypothetical protein NVP1195O_85 [Vibrio phage 1.195.O._10N.286.54.C8]AUR94635.1 hypothetical protein NVP1196O_82 [Vibrio phage 1.196.O._10N.286.54.E12]AUR95102.1 hypothetical protein NVP1200O_82 [Vibrio phage 1.200.O._10N.286.55.E1]AUR99590.1 hypothetical protein NVP1267O_82 [Vibrio phage 1.267.O._10N.286.54.A1]AUR99675.1 hypothe